MEWHGLQTWNNGAIAVLTVGGSLTANTSGTLNRTDTPQSVSAGMTAVYTGQISAQGNSITNGSVTWTWPGHSGYPTTGTWLATWQQIGPTVTVVSPFLLGAKGAAFSNFDLATLLPALPNLAVAAATGLAADGTSAAIALAATSSASDVTFTTNNGTALLLYDSQFLQKPPTLGSSQLVIPAANLMNIGGLLYAVALVQAPPPPVTPQYASPIVVTAQAQRQ
jgi:hypothetical protein